MNPSPIKKTRLRMMIEKRGLSQIQLADATGLEKYQISHLATGKKMNCSLETAKKICRALRCTLDEAFGDEELERNAIKNKK